MENINLPLEQMPTNSEIELNALRPAALASGALPARGAVGAATGFGAAAAQPARSGWRFSPGVQGEREAQGSPDLPWTLSEGSGAGLISGSSRAPASTTAEPFLGKE